MNQFDLAMTPLTALARQAPDAPGLAEVTGLAGATDPPAALRASGRATRSRAPAGSRGEPAPRQAPAGGGAAYDEVVAAYPDEAAVHYAYGVFLVRDHPDQGLAELRRSAQLRPDDVLAHLKIAFELLLRGDAAGARELRQGL